MRTLENIQKEYEVAKKEAETLIKARNEAVEKCNKLYQEIKEYKIQNNLFTPISELKKYKGKEISYIELVVRKENGELSAKDMWNNQFFCIDENGYLNYSSYQCGIMNYDKETKKYIYYYYQCPTIYNFVGYLEIKFEDDEENED